MPGIFISHTHGDQRIADALSGLIEGLFGREISVNYSSKKELDGGAIPLGADWFRWIADQVRQEDILAFILLTPASIQKPWVIWEAGAVAGATFATSADKPRVFPMTFGIRSGDIPTPFTRTQIMNGTDSADVEKLLFQLLGRFGEKLSREEVAIRASRIQGAVKTYLDHLSPLLRQLPLTVTEAAVQEWLGRLTELEHDNRSSEAQVMENWLDVAFGRDAEDRQRPFDVRIHRRLGELYLAAGQAADAARQFRLACLLAPRDIFLLRRLGKAYLDQKDLTQAGKILDDIAGLDPNAFGLNSENAALKARYFEVSNNLIGARDVLANAFQKIPHSYYLGDKLGQLLLKLGDVNRAKDVYRDVSRILRELREHNVWTYATALTAGIVSEDGEGVANSLKGLQRTRPSRGEIESIERGVNALVQVLNRGQDVIQSLREIETRQ